MRTFIAIEIPPEVKQQLRTEQNRLRDLLALHDLPPVLRWADPDKLHLTLRFLGDTDAIQRRQLQNGLAGIAARHGPFSLAPSRLGCFSSWNNLRVLWVGIGGDSAALQAVQSEVESLARQVGFPLERKRFSPHMTFARAVRNAPRAGLLAASEQLRRAAAEETHQSWIDWRVGELHFIRSVLDRGGAQYFNLATSSLTADA
jgi:2'-5' RNA ligase